MSLSKDEIKELVETMDLKIKEIILNRKHEESETKYNLSLITIPIEEKCRA